MAKSKMIVAYIVRHGDTELNEANCFRGPMNPPLNEHGIEQAEELHDFFKNKVIGAVFSSDKDRAVETTRIVLRGKNIPITLMADLEALNVGALGGKKRTPESFKMIEYYQEHPDVPFPPGPDDDPTKNGESLNQFRRRVRPILLFAFQKGRETGKPSLISGHSSIVHEVGELLQGDHTTTLVLPGGVVEVSISNGKYEARPILKPDHERMAQGKHSHQDLVT
jgi:broad specificity phosphatase PhoE